MKNIEKYFEFLETKKERITNSGFSISEEMMNKNLFPFQKFCVKSSLS